MAGPFPKTGGPMFQANGIVARLVMRGGTRLLRMAVDRTLGKAAPVVTEKMAETPPPAPVKAKGSITGKLAKTLYDRRQAKKNA
jgi:hypothetical protein